jgi:hypothetical protein
MVGLMNAAQGGGAPMPAGPMPAGPMQDAGPVPGREPPGGGAGGVRQANPEEQETYDAFVAQAMTLMYDKKMGPKLLQMLEGGGDPQEGLARAAVLVTARVATAAEEAGQKLSGEILFNAGTEIVNQLADVATEAGIHDFQNDPDALEGAYFRALDQFRQLMEGAGRLDRDAAMRDMQTLQAMDERGEFESMLRGLAENDPRRSPDAGMPAPDIMMERG